MSKQRLFLENIVTTTERVGNSMSTQYQFDGEKLSVYWKGEKREYPAKIGDAFTFDCCGCFPDVRLLVAPKSKGSKILWINGFTSKYALSSEQEVLDKAERIKKPYNSIIQHKPGKYITLESVEFDTIKNVNVYTKLAAWASDDISASDVEEINLRYGIGGNKFPKEYKKKFLLDYFQATYYEQTVSLELGRKGQKDLYFIKREDGKFFSFEFQWISENQRIQIPQEGYVAHNSKEEMEEYWSPFQKRRVNYIGI